MVAACYDPSPPGKSYVWVILFFITSFYTGHGFVSIGKMYKVAANLLLVLELECAPDDSDDESVLPAGFILMNPESWRALDLI